MRSKKTIDKQRKRKTRTINTKATGKDLEFLVSATEKELFEIIDSNIERDLLEADFYKVSMLFLDQSSASQRTLDSYKQLLRLRTLNFFGFKKVKDIKKRDINQFITLLRNNPSPRTGKPLSAKTIQHYRNLLRVIFNFAKDELEIIDKNPVDGVKIPTVGGEIKRDYLELEEVQETLTAMLKYADLKYTVFFLLQVYTGARPSEMYGLKWEKIDFSTGIITLNEALVKTSKGYVQKSTKTKDCRTQKLSPYILKKLRDLKDLRKTTKTDYIFTNPEGCHLGQAAFREYFRRFCDKHGVKYVCPYGLRHTSGTLLSESNIPLRSIGGHLGHTNQITTEKYIHATKRIEDEIEEILTRVITPKIIKIN